MQPSVNKSETEEHQSDTGKEVELVLENITLAINWLRTHWPGKPEGWIAWGTWFAVIAAIAYASIAACQLSEMRKTTVAAVNAANTARETLVRSQRPWLVNDGKADYSVQSWKDNQATLIFTFSVKNFGPSPALNVGYGIYPFVRQLPDKLPLFEDQRNQACKLADGMVPVSSAAIFPGQAMSYTVQGGFLVPGAKSNIPYVLFYGCLAYSDQFDATRTTHHTTFCLFGPVKPPHSLSFCGVNDVAD